MRILVASSPGVGHLLPLLPIARAAVARGHDVRIAGGASLASIAASAGLPFDLVGPPTIGSVALTIPGVAAATGRRRALLVFRGAFCGPIAEDMADDLDDLFGRWHPDVIVREDMAFGAWIAAERARVPDVVVQATAWRPNLRRLVGAPLDAIRVARGLATDPELSGVDGRLFFTTRPPALRDPDAPYPPGSLALRPIADDRHGGPQAQSDDEDPFGPPDGHPRVAITLGTVNTGEVAILRTLIDGALAAEARVVVALGADPATIGPVPDTVDVRAYVPMSTLLPTADVVAFHGGSGTMLAALGAGCPMVMVPLAADQPDNADRAAAAGVAVVVERESLTADAARAALRRVIDDPTFRAWAGAVADEIAAMPGPAAAVERIESLVASE